MMNELALFAGAGYGLLAGILLVTEDLELAVMFCSRIERHTCYLLALSLKECLYVIRAMCVIA
jgi:hypothetical protein